MILSIRVILTTCTWALASYSSLNLTPSTYGKMSSGKSVDGTYRVESTGDQLDRVQTHVQTRDLNHLLGKVNDGMRLRSSTSSPICAEPLAITGSENASQGPFGKSGRRNRQRNGPEKRRSRFDYYGKTASSAARRQLLSEKTTSAIQKYEGVFGGYGNNKSCKDVVARNDSKSQDSELQ